MTVQASATFVSHLACLHCERKREYTLEATVCPSCGGPLAVRYDLAALRQALGTGRWPVERPGPGLWRYGLLLPLAEAKHRVTLGEGATPLLPLGRLGRRVGVSELVGKWEGSNPTGTFKDRGMTLAVSMALARGVARLVVPTAGNAGASAAAYAARAGLPLTVFAPEDAPAIHLAQARSFGARVETVAGTIAEAGKQAEAAAQKEDAWNLATFREPYRLEGKKTMGLEVLEALGEAPDAIVYPTGGGTGLLGFVKAMGELWELGLLPERPPTRIYAVQAQGCAPLVEAFAAGRDRTVAPERPATVASGLRVPSPFAGPAILRAVRRSEGRVLAVSDDAIRQAMQRVARDEGLLVGPEAAATVAALPVLVENGDLHPKERVVCFLTGTGLKESPLVA